MGSIRGQEVPADDRTISPALVVLNVQGAAVWRPAGATNPIPLKANQPLRPSDRIETATNSRVLIGTAGLGAVQVSGDAKVEIRPPRLPGRRPILDLIKGVFFFFNRDQAIEMEIRNGLASATTLGTEFLMAVAEDGTLEVAVWDGEVTVRNAVGTVVLRNGQRGIAVPGQAPVASPGMAVLGSIQWCFYYPAVLDVDELRMTEEFGRALAASLAAFRDGDLRRALAEYPAGSEPGSDAERVYRAALLLTVGQVEAAESLLAQLQAASDLGAALRLLIAAVRGEVWSGPVSPTLASEWMALSYYRQSRIADDRHALEGALEAACSAVTRDPDWGLAWARRAELEFGSGRTGSARRSLVRALALSPHNAQAIALDAFLISARNKFREAERRFDEALTADGALANAWLGRGLCRVRQGRVEEGLQDLVAAAAVEPQRAVLRSYLGKAFAEAGRFPQATEELALARRLDPADPTAWLYTALLDQQVNRLNPAIEAFEQSQAVNDERRLYRSRLLLDQDRAVRGSTLAGAYRDAGMADVAVGEAARAVGVDYSQAAAHLFLADSYNVLRDPTRFNLRYETPWFSEWLLGNLLAPVGAGPLSQQVSLQEYSRLFERDRVSLVADTACRSDGQYREVASQFGTVGGTAWAIDLDFQRQDGVRVNNDLDRLELYTTVKQQLGPQDTAMLILKYQDYDSGDCFQHSDPVQARSSFRYTERQEPIALAGYHHEWTPGTHTLLLAGRLANDQSFEDRAVPSTVLFRDTSLGVVAHGTVPFDVELESEFEAATAELQHLQRLGPTTVIAGARVQAGTFDTRNRMTAPGIAPTLFLDPPANLAIDEDFERVSGYAYWAWEPFSHFALMPGVSYDQVRFPANFRLAPIAEGSEIRSQWSPKLAANWSPANGVAFRGAFARSLGGVTLDQSYRLEPGSLAGFPQTFRTVMPESLVGSVSAPEFEVWGIAADLRFRTRTYLTLQGERVQSDAEMPIGVFEYVDFTTPILPSAMRQALDFEERTASASVRQLLGDSWSLGARYAFSRATLTSEYPDIPASVSPSLDHRDRGDMHRVDWDVVFQHPSGFHATAQQQWFIQDTDSTAASSASETFQQLNLYAGYRLRRQRADLTLGVMNLTGEDYRLGALNVHEELPRERLFFVRFQFRF